MAEVDFSDFDSASAWFETQSIEVRCAMSSRAACRVFANFRAELGGTPNGVDMGVLRAILTSAGRGSGRPADVDWQKAADSAARYADSAARNAISAARYAAASAARNAASAARYAADSAARYADSARYAALWDAQHRDHLWTRPVWAGAEVPAPIAANHRTVLTKMKSDPAWDFWVRFYEGMWEGTFTDWGLAFEVIQIDEADWEKGYVHIGKVIAGIEARRRGDSPIETAEADNAAYRPNNVTQLFDNAAQVRASFELSASTLTERFDLFYQMACPNDVIPLFEPLRAMPSTLTRAAELLESGRRDDATESELKDLVATLRASLAKVEAELVAAKADIAELEKKPWYKSARVVAGGSVIGAILGTAWMVSGDELGPQKRWDMIAEYWEFVFPREELGEVCLHYELPESWDV